MSRNSLKLSPEGLKTANKAFLSNGSTQKNLAEKLGISRSTVSNFLRGEAIYAKNFRYICEELVLEWDEICEPQNNSSNIDTLVEDIQQKVQPDIKQSCGTIRVLEMIQPIELGSIYQKVNILKKITKFPVLDFNKLEEKLNRENFDRFDLNPVGQKRIEALIAVQDYRKLMVLGKPGAGKTTFLKYLAIQCSKGDFLKNCVPVFIPLKQFAETKNQPGLFDYIDQWLVDCGVTEAQTKAEQILKAGRALILLDGLDEVQEEDSNRIIKEIQEFSQKFSSSQFVVTCRIAANEYTFTHFTEVEIANFEDEQIKKFVNYWFKAKELDYADNFIQQLEKYPQIKELAISPLLLTLLCLEFEMSRNFPADRAELYKRATETLLRKWDNQRLIERQQVYQQLTVKRKEDLLSQIAFSTFKDKHYFFQRTIAENYIADYIVNLPDTPPETKKLHLDSEAVLKSIEAHHGLLVERAKDIYSFSHLTFQEYFTARKIFNEQRLVDLVEHITEKRWREVFLLIAGMLSNGDGLLKLIKQRIDRLLTTDKKLQEFLCWVNRKANSVKTNEKSTLVRAYYLNLSLKLSLYLSEDPRFNLSRDLSLYLNQDLSPDFNQNLSLYLSQDLIQDPTRLISPDLNGNLTRKVSQDLSLYLNQDLTRDLDRYLELDIAPELKQALQNLNTQLPKEYSDPEIVIQWWLENGQYWAKQLRNVMIEHRDIGHDWEFTKKQKKRLEKYLDANKLLLDCLKECLNHGYVNRIVREEIESTLFLPIDQA